MGCYCIRSKLLVFLKSYQNTVPVSRHWCQKRNFLQVSLSYLNRWLWVKDASIYDDCCLHVRCRDRVRKIMLMRFLLYVCMWCLQGSGCGNHQAWTCRCLAMSILDSIFIYFSVRLHANMGVIWCYMVRVYDHVFLV